MLDPKMFFIQHAFELCSFPNAKLVIRIISFLTFVLLFLLSLEVVNSSATNSSASSIFPKSESSGQEETTGTGAMG
jgi:YbbR domain-containing protein